MSDKTVGDLMHKGIIACKPETPMTEVVRIMVDTDVHAIIVVDDSSKARGIISHADIVRFYGQEISECTAGEAMSGRLLEIESGQPATLAAERMLEEGVQRLLVTECEGEERSRMFAAAYLGLARVRSAVPVFAAVSDQDVSLALRSLCAGMLIRRGQRTGVVWFGKLTQHALAMDSTLMVRNFARAVEDIVPLMLRCDDVNVGRFV